ncbi:MAG: 50S ribosomal protein L13 [Gammaproteobacteria bacterium]|nr:50S ribosomal protein L13 [Gammaproteobacteria bacterium]MCH9744375.1 50S ribosomal protein L13 [Gammaproteobacteria bacterium]
MKTYMANEQNITRKWVLLDAQNQVLGRLASDIAMRLRGKDKPNFTPHADAGDFVIVVNAEQLKVTGNKSQDKIYYRHSGYIGSLKEQSFNELLARQPERVLRLAVQGMLPKGPLGRKMLKKLKVYAGPEHPHKTQKPLKITKKEHKEA